MDLRVKKVILTSEFEKKKKSNEDACNTDVIVQLENGNKYIASFFTIRYIDETLKNSMKTGEFMDGNYFWNKNLVMVNDCSLSAIESVVQHMIDEGEFQEAFEEL